MHRFVLSRETVMNVYEITDPLENLLQQKVEQYRHGSSSNHSGHNAPMGYQGLLRNGGSITPVLEM